MSKERCPRFVKAVSVFLAFLFCYAGLFSPQEEPTPSLFDGRGFPFAYSQEKPVTILALGDSLTAGYGLPADKTFPAVLESLLRSEGYAVRVLNAGVSGDTTAGGLSRLSWSLADGPDIAIVELGANDGLRGVNPAQTEANLDAILAGLRQRGVLVLFTGMYAPPNMGKEYGQEFKAIFGRLAEKHDVLFYPFFLDGVAGNSALNQRDGLHPNDKGVEIIVRNLSPYVKQLVKKARNEGTQGHRK